MSQPTEAERAEALEKLAGMCKPVFRNPGRLVVTSELVGGQPWVCIALLPPLTTFAPWEEPYPMALAVRRVDLEAECIGWQRRRLWMYANQAADGDAFLRMLKTWELHTILRLVAEREACL